MATTIFLGPDAILEMLAKHEQEEHAHEARSEGARKGNMQRRIAKYLANPAKANLAAWRAGFRTNGQAALFVTSPRRAGK